MINDINESITIHGVFLDVFGLGVLLAGDSGIGKSEVALSLINRGHRLVADDAVEFGLTTANTVIGQSPALLQDFLEVRGLGILNIRVMFGDTAIKENKRLQLITNIVAIDDEALLSMDRLHGIHEHRNILGLDIPQVTIPVAPGRNLSVLIESAVRNEILKHTGYHATEEFTARQRELMGQVES